MQEPAHRFLGLTGCMFKQTEDYLAFHNKLEALKQKNFPHNPDAPIVLHRSEIIARRGCFGRLKDRDLREKFDRCLINLIENAKFVLFEVVIDKEKLRTSYSNPWHPYNMGLGFMLQRYCGLLNHLGCVGDVMAESRGGHEDHLLRNAYDHIYVHGDRYRKAEFYQRTLTSKEIKLKRKKSNISGLQLCDILAHPVKQYVLRKKHIIEDKPEDFGTRLLQKIEGKFNHHLYLQDRIEGYGWLLFPK